jgi:hypothetical protein
LKRKRDDCFIVVLEMVLGVPISTRNVINNRTRLRLYWRLLAIFSEVSRRFHGILATYSKLTTRVRALFSVWRIHGTQNRRSSHSRMRRYRSVAILHMALYLEMGTFVLRTIAIRITIITPTSEWATRTTQAWPANRFSLASITFRWRGLKFSQSVPKQAPQFKFS